ncbi:MAG: hypothetical protein CVT95_05645, partial [Bacteroidetes bacterium HGW-Bacteroidetes-12]
MSNPINIKNRRASFEYEFLEKFTTGIQLTGTEIKSIRESKVSIKEAFCIFKKNELFEDSNEIENVTFHNACIGEVVSLIYSPIFIQHNTIFDAILNRPIATEVGERGDGDFSFEEKQNWGIRFLSTLCPNCGWDLIAEKESCVLICSNCNSLWEASGETLRRIEFGVISEKDGRDDVAYLPFWRMKI